MKGERFVKAPSLASFTINSTDFFTSIQTGSQGVIDSFTMGTTQMTYTFLSLLQQVLDSFSLLTNNTVQTVVQSMNGIANSFVSGQTGTTGYNTGGYYF
jgi:hypothetical protein